MATINQLVRKPRKTKALKSDVPALKIAHKEGVCVLVCIQQRQKNQILLSEKYVE